MTLSIAGLGARQLSVYANLLHRENCKTIAYMYVMSKFSSAPSWVPTEIDGGWL
jgi:hypothetical protein